MKQTLHPGGLQAMSVPTRPGMVLLKPKNGPSFEVEVDVLKVIAEEHSGA